MIVYYDKLSLGCGGEGREDGWFWRERVVMEGREGVDTVDCLVETA